LHYNFIIPMFVIQNKKTNCMKKLILALLAVSSFSAANAQANSWLLYGNASYNQDKNKATPAPVGGVVGASTVAKDNSWEIAPGFGYQMNNHWTLGMNIGLGGNTSNNIATDTRVQDRNYAFGPFVRYTQWISKTFFLYGHMNINVLSGKSTTTTGAISGATNTTSTEDSYSGFNPAVIPGIGMNIKNGFAVNISFGSLSYSNVTTDFANKSSLNTSSLGFNFGAQNFAVGISKNFCTKGHHHGEGSESRRMKDDDKE